MVQSFRWSDWKNSTDRYRNQIANTTWFRVTCTVIHIHPPPDEPLVFWAGRANKELGNTAEYIIIYLVALMISEESQKWNINLSWENLTQELVMMEGKRPSWLFYKMGCCLKMNMEYQPHYIRVVQESGYSLVKLLFRTTMVWVT